MNYTPIGRVRPMHRGAHDPSAAYEAMDVVRKSDGLASYMAKRDVPAGTPLEDGEYWGLLSEVKGDAVQYNGAQALDEAQRAQARENIDAASAEEVSRISEAVGGMFVPDVYFKYFVFGELERVEMNWDFTRGEADALLCDSPDAPEFAVYGAPAFSEKGVYAHSKRGKDYIQLDLSFLKGKSWTMDVYASDCACTDEVISKYDVPVTLLADDADSPSWIYYPAETTGENGFAEHKFGMNAYGGSKSEASYSALDRRFTFIRSAEDGTMRCMLRRIAADGTEEITVDRTITAAAEPDALRLCNDAAVQKGCMLPIAALKISYSRIPEEV